MPAKDLPRQTHLIETIRDLRKPVTTTDDGWVTVADPNDELAPAFQNSWAVPMGGTPVSFFLDAHGVVRFRGDIDGGTSGTVAFTLPVGYRPEDTEYFAGINGSGTIALARIQVDPSGDVTIYTS